MLKKALENNFVKSVLILSSGTLIGQVIALAALPLLALIFTPEEFAYLGLFQTVVITASALCFFSLERTLPIALKNELPALFKSMASVFVLLFLPLFIIAMALHEKFPNEDVKELFNLKGIVYLLLFGAFITACFNTFNNFFTREKEFKLLATSKALQNLLIVITQSILGFLMFGAYGLILGFIIGRLTCLLWMAFKGSQNLKKNSIVDEHVSIKKVLGKYKNFLVYGSISSTIIILSANITVFLVFIYIDVRLAGLFVLIQRVCTMPLTLVGQSVGQVYLAEAGLLVSNNNSTAVSTLFYVVLKKLALIGVTLVIPAVIACGVILELFLNDKWDGLLKLSLTLLPIFVLQFVVSPLSQTPTILNKQYIDVILSLVRIALLVGVFYFGSQYGLAEWDLLLLFSIASSVSYLLFLFIYYMLIKKL